jgi:hypothetical protein
MGDRLYDFLMDAADRSLFFSPGLFPPKPERCIELVDTFRRCGYTLLVVDWGNLFPWSEERFQCPLTYPEHAVVEIHRRASESGLTLLPRLPVGGGMSNFLSPPGFRSLRLDRYDPEVLDPAAPGAAKFVTDLLEDMRALLPDLPGVYIDFELCGTKDDRDINDSLGCLISKVLEEAGRLPIIAGPSFSGDSGESDCYTSLVKNPECFCEQNYRGLPPTAEIFLDLMQKPSAGALVENDPDLNRARELRTIFEHFLKALDHCWNLIRTVRESTTLSPSMGYSPERSRVLFQRTIDELHQYVQRMTDLLESVETSLKPLIAPGILQWWGRSRIDSVREQISQLQVRSWQVETWIEME